MYTAEGRQGRTIVGRAIVLGLVLFASYAYFYEGGGWNQNTRFDLVRAIVERHTLEIDAYQDNTGDKAEVGPHYFADKAPGASLVAVPAVALARDVFRLLGRSVTSDRAVSDLSFVATLAGSSLPSVVAAVCVFFAAVRLGAPDGAAGLSAVACGLGTPLWPYATLLYGHTLAAGCLMAAFAGALAIPDVSSPPGELWLGALIGVSSGWAVVTEYPAAVASTVVLLFAAWQARGVDRRRTARLFGAALGGLAVTAAVLLVYNRAAFGAALHVSYTDEGAGFAAMHTGLFGVSWPQWSVARELLVGEYRGLLPLAPVLVLAPAGLWWLVRDRKTRAAGLTATAVAGYYFLMTAGYAYWSGGWSYGSRHLGPALPFLCLGLAPIWPRAKGVLRAVVFALTLVGVAESLVAVATTPQPPADVARPMRELLWPAFRSGDFPIGWQSILDVRPPPEPMSDLEREHVPRASWNAGQTMGLDGQESLLPLLAMWLIGAGVWELAGRGRPSPVTRAGAHS